MIIIVIILCLPKNRNTAYLYIVYGIFIPINLLLSYFMTINLFSFHWNFKSFSIILNYYFVVFFVIAPWWLLTSEHIHWTFSVLLFRLKYLNYLTKIQKWRKNITIMIKLNSFLGTEVTNVTIKEYLFIYFFLSKMPSDDFLLMFNQFNVLY